MPAVAEREASFTCPLCRRTSYNRDDVEQRFCGCCGNDEMPKTCEHREAI